jgi:hypothetical protein
MQGREAETVTLGVTEWRNLGKPRNADEYKTAQERAESGERREFTRYEVQLRVRLSRLASWKSPASQSEDTVTEVLARGGALVRTRMAVDSGETLMFRVGEFETRAEVRYAAPSPNGDFLRLGLRFLDAPLPDHLIPKAAPPIA